jgi:hypothetical protein
MQGLGMPWYGRTMKSRGHLHSHSGERHSQWCSKPDLCAQDRAPEQARSAGDEHPSEDVAWLSNRERGHACITNPLHHSSSPVHCSNCWNHLAHSAEQKCWLQRMRSASLPSTAQVAPFLVNDQARLSLCRNGGISGPWKASLHVSGVEYRTKEQGCRSSKAAKKQWHSNHGGKDSI